jgi:autotransporter-associated beta strand protein
LIVGINQVSQVNQGVGMQGPFSVNENTSKEFQLRQTDDDGDQLKYSFEGNSAGMNPFAAYLGTVELLGDISTSTRFRYTPANKLTGTDEIRGTVTDAKGATLPVRIFITVTPNVVPVAIAPSSSVKQSGGSSQVITLDASDANGDVITYKISNAPSHGTVTIVGNIATYVRNSTYFGADSFTFVANDGHEDSLPVTVVIHPDHFTSSVTSGNFSDPIWGADNEAPQVLGAPEYRLTFNAGTSATLNNDLGAFEFNEMRFSGNAATLTGLAIKAAGVTPTLFVDTASPVVLNTEVIVPADTTLALKGTGTGNLTLAGVVSGLGSIRKETLATLTLPDANPSFTGGLTVTRGTVEVEQMGAASTGTITLASTVSAPSGQFATLNLSSPSGGTLVNNLVVDQTNGRNSLTATGSHELSGPVTIRGGNIFTVSRQGVQGSLKISGNVTGDGAVVLSLRSGGGELRGRIGLSNVRSRLEVNDTSAATFWTLSGTGSNWGQTDITNAANLRLGATNALSTRALLSFGNSSTGGLDLAGWNQTLGGLSSLSLSTKVYNSSTTRDAMLTLDVPVGVNVPVFRGQLRDRLDNPSSPEKRLSLTLSKGSQTLAGTNTYTGNTVINAGTLTVDTNGQLTFRVVNPSDSSTTTTNITGAGSLAFNGRLAVDTKAVTVASGTWSLIKLSTAARATYATTFSVGGSGGETWTKDTTGKWNRSEGKKRWVFNAGVLTLTTTP